MEAIDRRFLFLLAAAFFVGGCDGAPPTQAFEDEDPSFAVEVEDHEAEHGPVVASVRGGGHYFLSQDDGEKRLRRTSVVGLRYADGTVRGQFEIWSPELEQRAHGTVTCLEIVGNQAWIGGDVTSSSEPEWMPVLEGHETGFRVEDNSANSEEPDRISRALAAVRDEMGGLIPPPANTAERVCHGELNGALPLEPIHAGNLTVEDVDDDAG